MMGILPNTRSEAPLMYRLLLCSLIFPLLALPAATARGQSYDLLFVVDETATMAAEISTLQSNGHYHACSPRPGSAR